MYSLMMTANGHVDPRSSLSPPIIMRTAATPMPTPKSSLGPESILGEEHIYREATGHGYGGDAGSGYSEAVIGHVDSRRGSSASMDPSAYDQRSLVSDGRASNQESAINGCEEGQKHGRDLTKGQLKGR